MADEPATTEPEATPDGTDARLSRLESAVDTIKNILTGAHKDATATTDARLSEPTSIADEVQRELARAEKERRDNETAAEREARLKGVEDTVVKLTEKTPQPPPRKIERIMGWHG
jgi:hypothetical protein